MAHSQKLCGACVFHMLSTSLQIPGLRDEAYPASSYSFQPAQTLLQPKEIATCTVCHSAVAQSHRICSVWHRCVVTYGPTWLPTISSQRCVSSHPLFIPPLLTGYQFFVLTGTATSRAGSGAQFVLGCRGPQSHTSHTPWLPGTSFG